MKRKKFEVTQVGKGPLVTLHSDFGRKELINALESLLRDLRKQELKENQKLEVCH